MRAAELARAPGDRAGHVVLAGDVAADRHRPAAAGGDIRGYRRGGIGAQVGYRYGDALGGQPRGARGADAGAAAGDECCGGCQAAHNAVTSAGRSARCT